MKTERWAEVESLLRAALDSPREGRSSFLDAACQGDAKLRSEVESYLNEEDGAQQLLERPALTLAARVLAIEKTALVGHLVGPYEVMKWIGGGGMGEVFLARDTRLRRPIALKILPREFTADPDRVRRFEQEARAASALDHPNVLVVHDVGVHDGLPYIASEYLEGETLRQRLDERRLPITKALEYGVQIAQAIAAAHNAGIMHRDLKPENIFITSEGRIKVLDFGIAKLADDDCLPVSDSVPDARTATGMIIGTVGYLSPEQVSNHNADFRSDIFSFGCVLYEMITGSRAFPGESAIEVMTAVLGHEPPIPASLPSDLTRILRRCLEKRPAERFQSAVDIAFILESTQTFDATAYTASAPPTWRSRVRTYWFATALLLLTTVVLACLLLFRKPPGAPVLRFEIPIPGDPITSGPAVAISPNGKSVAFIAMGTSGHPILWIRDMAAVAPRPVPGTEDARYPFWSADSRFLGYYVGDRLRSLELASGEERVICTVHGVVNGAWNDDDVILISTGSGPLRRVPLDGGPLQTVTQLDLSKGQRAHWWPSFLPDNNHFLYTVNASTPEESGIFAASLENGRGKQLVRGVITNAVYLPPGYLLYSRDGNLVARRFNAGRLRIQGPELHVAERLQSWYGYTAFSASRTGTVVFRSGDQGRYQLAWFDRTGRRLPLGTQSAVPSGIIEGILPLAPVLSPNGALLATVRYQPTNHAYGIWATALNRAGIQFPVTDVTNAESPVWSPDSTQLAYSASPSGGSRDIYIKRLDQTSKGRLAFHSEEDEWPLDWSRNNELLLYTEAANGERKLWTVAASGGTPIAVHGSPDDVQDARLSPDGHWLAYSSERSGASLIYVQDFPAGEARVPVSDRGARCPIWRRDGSELYYAGSNGTLFSVPINTSDGRFSAGAPIALFKTDVAGKDPYTVARDGQHFLVQIPLQNTATPVISVILNWSQSSHQ